MAGPKIIDKDEEPAKASALIPEVLRVPNQPQEEVELVRRVLLTEKGCRYVEDTFESTNKQVTADVARSFPSSSKLGRFYAYYDTKTLALIRQNAWLREHEDEFDMQVGGSSSTGLLSEDRVLPSKLQCGPIDARKITYKSVLNCDSINRRLTSKEGQLGMKKTVSFRPDEDLVETQELDNDDTNGMRKERSSTLGSMTPKSHNPEGENRLMQTIAKEGLKPFMRARTDHIFLDGGSFTCAGHNVEMNIDLEVIRFDVRFAEPAALSAILGELNVGIKDNILTVGQGSFRVRCDSSEVAIARRDLESHLAKHRLDGNSDLVRQGNSIFLTYLQICRPGQLRALLRAGVDTDDDDRAQSSEKANLNDG